MFMLSLLIIMWFQFWGYLFLLVLGLAALLYCGSPWAFHIFLAHLSRRLIGELIVYPCSGVRRRRYRRYRRCRCRRPPFSNVLSSETAWQIKAKFYAEPPWEGGTKVCINGPGHMTKMAAMPTYGKNL